MIRLAWRFARAAWRGIGWKHFAVALAVGAALLVVNVALMASTLTAPDNFIPEVHALTADDRRFSIGFGGLMMVVPIFVLLSTRLAEHAARPDAAGWAAYVAIALIATLMALVSMSVVLGEGGEQPSWTRLWMGSQLFMGVGLAVLIYGQLRRAAHARAALASVEMSRAEERKRVLDARLKAIHSKIEPELLFAWLDRIEALYDTDREAANLSMDELIAYLRAALPRLDST